MSQKSHWSLPVNRSREQTHCQSSGGSLFDLPPFFENDDALLSRGGRGRESAATVERKGNTCRVYLSRGASSAAVNLSISVDSTSSAVMGPKEAAARGGTTPPPFGERKEEEKEPYIYIYMAAILEALLSRRRDLQLDFWHREKSLTMLFFECRIGTADGKKMAARAR